MTKKIKVLFLCTGNSCRSQMAEGWAKALKSDCIEAYSAGIETHGLNPNAIQVMSEVGIDITTHKSQHISEFANVALDYVVTVCGHAHETCPLCPNNAVVIHQGFDDPPKLAKAFSDPQKQLNCYRHVRDAIRFFVLSLPESLTQED